MSARVQSSAKAALSKMSAITWPEARVPTAGFGQSLDGLASVGIGAQPLLG